ncbi:dephospho-CoA kinase [Thalassotalea agarivorans]|uniref:Dephospho-CoA kinase n=1 Tax=Thalassotalea agarivorans TaxID=349064 RepID=A0A1H9Y353_THASX|nr:dephospho-CoA kinase [Thalassotalea agarivorans]SES63265.1 dephospho-CoA kinase [Thalassotalea agarivorans]
MSNLIIGLTGGIGSGKTTVANLFIALGVDAVDADQVARDVVIPGTLSLSRIVERYSDDILLATGELNRAKLREIVFNNDAEKQWLNDLLHPLIREKMLRDLAACDSPYCLLIAPLLIENDLTKYVDKTLVVDVPEEIQLTRTLKRDKSNETTIRQIMKSQITRKKRLASADYIIDNTSENLAVIEESVFQLHQKFTELASN